MIAAPLRRPLLIVVALVASMPLLEARPNRARVQPFQMAVPEIPYPDFVSPTETPYNVAGGGTGRPAMGDAASFDVVLELVDAGSTVERPPVPRLPPAAFVRYPTAMLWSATTGDVLARVTVDEAGNATSVQLLRASAPSFGAAVLKGLARYRFSPAMSGEVPVAFRGTYKVRFVLPD